MTTFRAGEKLKLLPTFTSTLMDHAQLEKTLCRHIIRGQKCNFCSRRLLCWQKELFVAYLFPGQNSFVPMLFYFHQQKCQCNVKCIGRNSVDELLPTLFVHACNERQNLYRHFFFFALTMIINLLQCEMEPYVLSYNSYLA